MALMTVMMSIFVVLVLAPDFIISNPTDRELSFVWEIAYLAGGLLSMISCISWSFSIIPPYCLECICIKSIVRMLNGRKILFMLGLREYGDRLIVQFVQWIPIIPYRINH